MPSMTVYGYPTGQALYAVVRSGALVAGASGFVAYTTSNRNTNVVALTETDPGTYAGAVPTWLTTGGSYPAPVYRRVGGAPAETDPVVGDETLIVGLPAVNLSQIDGRTVSVSGTVTPTASIA